jgi:hypothetical protein
MTPAAMRPTLAGAIQAAQHGLAALPAGSGERHDYLAILAVCLWERYDATGSLTDLEQAIDMAAEAVAGTAADAPYITHCNRHRPHRARNPWPPDSGDILTDPASDWPRWRYGARSSAG